MEIKWTLAVEKTSQCSGGCADRVEAATHQVRHMAGVDAGKALQLRMARRMNVSTRLHQLTST